MRHLRRWCPQHRSNQDHRKRIEHQPPGTTTPPAHYRSWRRHNRYNINDFRIEQKVRTDRRLELALCVPDNWTLIRGFFKNLEVEHRADISPRQEYSINRRQRR